MKARVLSFFRTIGLGVAATFLVAAAASPQASAPDVGLITKLSGAVTYWNKAEQKEPVPAKAFMKVRQGDHFKLAPAGSLTLLYFASGRQEIWKGPATFSAGATESATVGDRKPLPQPEVQILPTKVTKPIAGAPLPLPGSSMGRSGVIQTMAPMCPAPAKAKTTVPLSKEAQEIIKEAEKLYQDMRKRAGAEDVTPELYFMGILADYQQYTKMEKLVDAMLAKRPGDPTLENLKGWVRSQAAAGQ
jgi:hypothetical protein